MPCPWLEDSTIFDLVKMGQDHDQFCLILKNVRELAKKFFPEERLKFAVNLQNFGTKTFFFLEKA